MNGTLMVADECSQNAREVRERAGAGTHDRQLVFETFRRHNKPLTTRQAATMLEGTVEFSSVKSRITELTSENYLVKLLTPTNQKPVCPETGKRVNQWKVHPRFEPSYSFPRDLFN